jgi:hypothetical protein
MAISSTLTDLDLRMALVPGMAPHILCRVDSSVFPALPVYPAAAA